MIEEHKTTSGKKDYPESLLNITSSIDLSNEPFNFDSMVITRRNNLDFASSHKTTSVIDPPTGKHKHKHKHKQKDQRQNQLFSITIPSFDPLNIETEDKPLDLLRFLVDSKSGILKEETIKRKQNKLNINTVINNYDLKFENLSSLPTPLTKLSLNTWIHDVLELEKSESQLELLKPIFDDLMKNHEYCTMLDKESIKLMLRFYGRNNDFDRIFELKELVEQSKPSLNFYLDFGVEFLRYSILDSSSTSPIFIEFLKSMKKNNLKLDSNLLYSVFYLLDRFQRIDFLKLLKSRGITITGRHREFIFVSNTETSDQLMSSMNRSGREWTPGLVQFACELMLEEGKLVEAWFFMKQKYFKHLDQDLITTRTGILFIDYLKENKMAYNIPSFLICINSMTQQNFDDYGYMKLIEDRIELGTKITNWRYLTRALIDLPQDGKLRNKLLNKVNSVVTSTVEGPFTNTLTFDESNVYESLTNPPIGGVSIFYKARWNPLFTRFLSVESLRELFYPTDRKFDLNLQLIDFTLYKQFDGNPILGWSEFCKLTNNENLEMNHDNTRRFINYFMGSNEFYFAFAFLKYLDQMHGVNIQADGYCNMLHILYKKRKVSKNWLFVVKLLRYLTSYNTTFWDPDGTRKQLFEDLAHENGYHDFKIDEITPLELENIHYVIKNLKWESSLNFILEKNSGSFKKAANFLKLGKSRYEIRSLIKSKQLEKAWSETFKSFTEMPQSIAEIFIYYFDSNNQLHNLYLFAEWIKSSSKSNYADELYQRIMRRIVRGLIVGDNTTLSQNQVTILKLIYSTTRNQLNWNKSDYSRVLTDKLAKAGMTTWKFSENELNIVLDIKNNLKWNLDNTGSPIFDSDENSEEFRIVAGWFTKKILPVTLIDLDKVDEIETHK